MDIESAQLLHQKYFAACQWLSADLSGKMNYLQKTKLKALQYHIVYGPNGESQVGPNLFNRKSSEGALISDEWQRIRFMSQRAAMASFVDTIKAYWPNWQANMNIRSIGIQGGNGGGMRQQLMTPMPKRKKLSVQRRKFAEGSGRQAVSLGRLTSPTQINRNLRASPKFLNKHAAMRSSQIASRNANRDLNWIGPALLQLRANRLELINCDLNNQLGSLPPKELGKAYELDFDSIKQNMDEQNTDSSSDWLWLFVAALSGAVAYLYARVKATNELQQQDDSVPLKSSLNSAKIEQLRGQLKNEKQNSQLIENRYLSEVDSLENQIQQIQKEDARTKSYGDAKEVTELDLI